MNSIKRKISAIIAAVLISYTGGFAQSSHQLKENELLELSLEELMNITVTTASKNNESVKDAPAIISVITAKEIEAYGATSLGQILDRATGTYFNGTYFGKNNLSIRGDHTGIYDTHVLLLINGRPFRESMFNGANFSVVSMLPVDNIEQIEIIRGPGSVLYGTSAYSGVINIITKQVSTNTFKSFIRYGSFNTLQAGVSGAATFKGIQVNGAVNYFDSKGWDFTARDEKAIIRNKANTADSTLKDQLTIPMAEQGLGSMLQIAYKDFKLSSGYMFSDQRIMGRLPVWGTPIQYSLANGRGFVDAGYSHSFSKVISTSINLTYNHLTSRHYVPLVEYKEDLTLRNSDDVLLEVTSYIKPVEKLNIVIGALANMQHGWATQPELNSKLENFDVKSATNPDPYYQVPTYQETWASAYFQADYKPFNFVKVIAGGQLNKVAGLRASFVPRLGSIFSITDKLTAKVLYGQAFRSAAFFEKYTLSLPGIAGNKNLTPELISTFETQLSYSLPKAEIAITYFNSEQSALITRSNVKDSLYIIPYKGVTTSIPQYINKGELASQGVELEGKAHLTAYLSATGSLAYQTNKNTSGNKDVYGMPKMMAKLGLHYSHEKGIGIAVFNSYFGKGGDISIYNNGILATKEVNPQVKAYNYLSVNINADIFKLLNVSTALQGIVNIYATNLLDEQIAYPELSRRNINSLPGRPGRSLYGSIQLKF